MATANGDLRIFSRDRAGEWSETFLSDDTEQLDESGSLILEALYEEKSTITRDEAPGLEEEDPEAEEDEEPEAEDDEEPEAAEEEPEGGDEAAAEEEDEEEE